eukprot:TRINITY_DN5968_c0_g1_i1.p1 TRINITY_DN5968_c0_g1~~TRINITY_DN5968_c0_g1_i1.p1  ORF type:complete len:957 (+),score=188.19 TRINITY_DN5968_c0_g1_i1:37-2907(+)
MTFFSTPKTKDLALLDQVTSLDGHMTALQASVRDISDRVSNLENAIKDDMEMHRKLSKQVLQNEESTRDAYRLVEKMRAEVIPGMQNLESNMKHLADDAESSRNWIASLADTTREHKDKIETLRELGRQWRNTEWNTFMDHVQQSEESMRSEAAAIAKRQVQEESKVVLETMGRLRDEAEESCKALEKRVGQKLEVYEGKLKASSDVLNASCDELEAKCREGKQALESDLRHEISRLAEKSEKRIGTAESQLITFTRRLAEIDRQSEPAQLEISLSAKAIKEVQEIHALIKGFNRWMMANTQFRREPIRDEDISVEYAHTESKSTYQSRNRILDWLAAPRGVAQDILVDVTDASQSIRGLHMQVVAYSVSQGLDVTVKIRYPKKRLRMCLREEKGLERDAQKIDDEALTKLMQSVDASANLYSDALNAAAADAKEADALQKLQDYPSLCRSDGKLVEAGLNVPDVCLQTRDGKAVESIEALLEDAQKAQATLKRELAGDASWEIHWTPDEESLPYPECLVGEHHDPGIKSRRRLEERLKRMRRGANEKDRVSEVVDVSRFGIVFCSFMHLLDGLRKLRMRFEDRIMWLDNRFLQPTVLGYSDVNIGIRTSLEFDDGTTGCHVTEVQLLHRAIDDVKQGLHHTKHGNIHDILTACGVSGQEHGYLEEVILATISDTNGSIHQQSLRDLAFQTQRLGPGEDMNEQLLLALGSRAAAAEEKTRSKGKSIVTTILKEKLPGANVDAKLAVEKKQAAEEGTKMEIENELGEALAKAREEITELKRCTAATRSEMHAAKAAAEELQKIRRQTTSPPYIPRVALMSLNDRSSVRNVPNMEMARSMQVQQLENVTHSLLEHMSCLVAHIGETSGKPVPQALKDVYCLGNSDSLPLVDGDGEDASWSPVETSSDFGGTVRSQSMQPDMLPAKTRRELPPLTERCPPQRNFPGSPRSSMRPRSHRS